MKVFISLLPSTEDECDTSEVAVVIDVLRATSVMATAIAAQATRVITCGEVAEALRWKAQFDPSALLCGERRCQRIEGFDLGNSPGEYSAANIFGRTLVLTTTNGTRAINAVQNAKRIIAASFLNMTAVVEAIADSKTVRLVCAGTDGHETDEDTMLAGAIAEVAREKYGAELAGDDGAERAVQRWRTFRESQRTLVDELRETAGGRTVRYGFEDDLARCARIDFLDVVPEQSSRDPPIFT